MSGGPSVLTAYRWELRKLVAQRRTYIGIVAAALLPVSFVVVMAFQEGGPYDAPLAHNLRHTGVVVALVVLTIAARAGAQLVTALVAGDIVAAEDAGDTLKMILTRSLKRSQILAGKTLASFTYLLALLAALLAAGLLAGVIAWGFHPVTNLSLERISALHAFGLSLAALGLFAFPLAGIAAFAIFLSTVTRNSAAAIVGTLVYQLAQEALAGLVHLSFFRHYLLSAQFDGWQGLFHTPTDWTLIIRSVWVSVIFTALPLAAAFAVFLRRDVAGD